MTQADGRTAEIAAAIANHPEAKNLPEWDRALLQGVLEQHPKLTIDVALRDLREAGM
jgi:hypothetical protein